MIAFIAGSIYLPGMFINPEHDFIYASGDDYNIRYLYDVVDGKLVKKEYPDNRYRDYPLKEPKLYYHDVESDQSREITFEEAAAYTLDSSLQSPDGFTVERGRGGGSIFSELFYSSSSRGNMYLVGDKVSKKINLKLSGRDYYYNFTFLGWVL